VIIQGYKRELQISSFYYYENIGWRGVSDWRLKFRGWIQMGMIRIRG